MTTLYKYCIASYTHYLNGKSTNLGGPAQHLARYLGEKAYCIWQPIPINKSNLYYLLLKFRDILLVLFKHKPAEVFIGVESVNALLGKLLGYKRVIYWNLDYSPRRQFIWNFLDMLALRYADEVWTLKDRGVGRVVPIGCWFHDIDRSPKRELGSIVYIGLLQDSQGVLELLKYRKKIIIIGTGKDEAKYKKMAKNNVTFTGVISDLEAQKIMTHCDWGWDIYSEDNPTHATTLPTKPMTYMSCGLRLMSNPDLSRKQCIDYARKHDWNIIFKKLCI